MPIIAALYRLTSGPISLSFGTPAGSFDGAITSSHSCTFRSADGNRGSDLDDCVNLLHPPTPASADRKTIHIHRFDPETMGPP
jgi:hypothetical protein